MKGRVISRAVIYLPALVFAALLLAPCRAWAEEPLKLERLLAEAETNNPMLAARRSAYEAAKERIPQAGALDNPMLGIGFQSLPVDSFAFDREDMTGKMLELSQAVPFFGKRGLRREAARAEAEAAGSEYKEQALMVRAEVRGVFYDLYYIKKSSETVEKGIRLMEEFKKSAEARYSVGGGMMKDVIKSQVEISMLMEKRIDLQKEETAKRAYLGSLLGRKAPVAGDVPDIAPTDVKLDRERLAAAAADAKPSLAAAGARIQGSRTRAELAYRERYPDVTFKLSYMQRDRLRGGTGQPDMISAMVSVDLPVWYKTKLNPMVREAAAEQAMAVSEREAVLAETYSKIYGMAGEIEQSDRMLKLYRDALIPQASQDVSSGLAAYETGRGDFLTLLDSRRTLFDLELGYYKTLAMREKAVAELGAAVGKEFQE